MFHIFRHDAVNEELTVCGVPFGVCRENGVVRKVEGNHLTADGCFAHCEDLEDVDYVLQGLKDIGFDDVYEVSKAAELVSAYTRTYLKTVGIPKPVINSACPVVLRLISLRYPTLKEHIMQILPPMEIAAKLALERAQKEHPELTREDICVCFISPCPGKVSYVRNGFGDYQSEVDEVLSISDVYFSLINVMRRGKEPENLSQSGMIGISWATTGGEASALFNDKYLAADGIDNVNRVLEQLDNGNIAGLEFVELNACPGGCVGGAMVVENPFVARSRLLYVERTMPESRNWDFSKKQVSTFIPGDYFLEETLLYDPPEALDSDRRQALLKRMELERIAEELPSLDCGACGAPTCRALAEDIVRGTATMEDCLLLGRVQGNQAKEDDT